MARLFDAYIMVDWSAAASWAYRGGVATRAAWVRERWFPDPNCKGRTSRRQRERASHQGGWCPLAVRAASHLPGGTTEP